MLNEFFFARYSVNGEMPFEGRFYLCFEPSDDDPRLVQELAREVIGIAFRVDNLRDARINEHFGALRAGLRRAVERGTFDGDTVTRGLDDGILLGMDTAAQLMLLTRGNPESLAQTANVKAMRKPPSVRRCSRWR